MLVLLLLTDVMRNIIVMLCWYVYYSDVMSNVTMLKMLIETVNVAKYNVMKI